MTHLRGAHQIREFQVLKQQFRQYVGASSRNSRQKRDSQKRLADQPWFTRVVLVCLYASMIKLRPVRRPGRSFVLLRANQSQQTIFSILAKFLVEHSIADPYMRSIRPIKRTFAMFRNFRMATVAIMLAFATTGVAHARSINHHTFQAGYAGPVYSSRSSVGSWGFVPGRGIVGESCDLPSSACSNDERVTG
jgi:hypothetical protein